MLHCEIPETVRLSLAYHLPADHEVRFSVRGDLDVDQHFGEHYVIITREHLVLAGSDGVHETIPLARVKEARVDELFGGSRLVVVLKDDGEPHKRLAYYSKAYIPEFGTLCRVINDITRGVAPQLPADDGGAHCPTCGLPLPERGERCPACVPRRAIMRRLLKLMHPYRWRLRLLVCMTFISVAAQMGPPYILKRVIDDVIRASAIGPLAYWIAAWLGCGLLYLGAQLVQGTLSAWLGSRVTSDLRSGVHAHLQRLQLSYFGKREAGEIVSRAMRDTGRLQKFLIEGLPFLFVNLISFLAIAVILLKMDVYLALVVFVPAPIIVIGVKFFWRKLIPLFHKAGSRYGGLTSVLGESVRGVKAVKAASDESGRAERFDHFNESLFKTEVSIERNWLGFQRGSLWFMSVATVAMWTVGTVRIVHGGSHLTIGTLFAFQQYIGLFYGPLQWVSVVLNWMSDAFVAAERVFGILDTKPEVYEAADAIRVTRIKGSIRFEDVHFSYDRGKEVIKGINLDIKPGEMIGLVGKSGAGKSTVINLICRFYDADSGRILIDGHPIDRIRLQDLRHQIGIVMQEPFLFRSSILENIRYGSPDKSFDDVVRAARAANAHEFIVDKEHGYDSVIGDGAEALSVGEKQRIAIARAILHDPPILILDEATSSVDTETEQAIQQAITRLVADRTTIAIAHRLATLRNASRLIVVDEGLIVESGTHDELIASGGIYAGLIKTQAELSKMRSQANVWAE